MNVESLSFDLDFKAEPTLPAIDDRIAICWPLNDAYYTVYVNNIQTDGNSYQICYDDGETENLNLANEVWRFNSANAQPPAVTTEEQEVMSS